MASKKRGLGRGLDALIGSATVQQGFSNTVASNQIIELPLAQIQPGVGQPRTQFNSESLHQLAESIRTQGVIQPIVVRELESNRYEIIAGERRWRACQQADLETIPAVIREFTDQEARIIALIENIQREDLNPLDEASSIKKLIESYELTHLEVAQAIGRSRATVTNLLRLMELSQPVKTLLQNGLITMGHARALLGLDPETQLQLAELTIAQHLSVRELERKVKQQGAAAKNPTAAVDADERLAQFENSLTHTLSLPVKISEKNDGSGKILIQYNDAQALEKLIEQLS